MTRFGCHFALPAILAALGPVLSVQAQATSDDAAATFTLTSPELFEVGPASHSLASGDLNGDGVPDLICVDNGKNLLYLLHGQSGGEAGPFEVVEMPAESVVGSLAVADFNGDGRDDLALGGSQSFVRYQDEDGDLGLPRELDEDGRWAIAADLNDDGRTDLLLADAQRLVEFLQDQEGRFEPPHVQRNVYSIAGRPLWCDVNGDGRADLSYQSSENRELLIVRFRNASGGFDPEVGYRSGILHDLAGSARLGAGGPGLLGPESSTFVLKVLRLADDPLAAEEAFSFSRPRMIPVSSEELAAGDRFALTPVPFAGSPALVVLVESQPEMGLLRFDAEASLERRAVSVLLGAAKVRRSFGDGERLWMLSRREKTIGVSQLDGDAIPFPQPLELGAEPQAFELADLDGSGGDDLVFAANLEGKPSLVILADPRPEAFREAERTVIDLQQLDGSTFRNAEIEELLAADLNNDGRPDLALWPKYGALQIIVQSAEGEFDSLLGASGVKQGLFEGVRPGQFQVVDLGGDGASQILIAKESFARLIQLGPDGELTVLHQFNGKSGASRIASVVAADLTGDGRREVALLDKGNERLVTIYQKADEGTGDEFYKLLKHVEIDPLAGSTLHAADLNGDGREDLAIAGDRAIGVVFSGMADPVLSTVASARTPIREGGYRIAAVGDLLSDREGDEILALENREHVFEFFTLGPDDAIEPFNSFKVFSGEGSVGFVEPDRSRPPSPAKSSSPISTATVTTTSRP